MQISLLEKLLQDVDPNYTKIIYGILLVGLLYKAILDRFIKFYDKRIIEQIKIKNDKQIDLVIWVYTMVGIVNMLLSVYIASKLIIYIPYIININYHRFLGVNESRDVIVGLCLFSFLVYIVIMEITLFMISIFLKKKKVDKIMIKKCLRLFYGILSFFYIGIALQKNLINWVVVMLFYIPMIYLYYKLTVKIRRPVRVKLYMKDGSKRLYSYKNIKDKNGYVYVAQSINKTVYKVTEYKKEDILKKDFYYE